MIFEHVGVILSRLSLSKQLAQEFRFQKILISSYFKIVLLLEHVAALCWTFKIFPMAVTHDVVCILLANCCSVGASLALARNMSCWSLCSEVGWVTRGLCMSAPVRLNYTSCSVNVEHIPPIRSGNAEGQIS